jgi:non-ribosomal peptide synthetase component E (peptide arylation enzyme)
MRIPMFEGPISLPQNPREAALLAENLEAPGRTALVDARGRMTYAALQMQVDQCALGLLGLSIRRGDVVTAQLPNWNEFVVLTLALERIGAVINPVAPSSASVSSG